MRQTLRESLTSPVRPTDRPRADLVLVAVPDGTTHLELLAERLDDTLRTYGLIDEAADDGMIRVVCSPEGLCPRDNGHRGVWVNIAPDDLYALQGTEYREFVRTVTNLCHAGLAAHLQGERTAAAAPRPHQQATSRLAPHPQRPAVR